MIINKSMWPKYNAEFRIAHGMILPSDPPLQEMTVYRQDIERILTALGYEPLMLLERANVEAATGSPRTFCYIGVWTPDQGKLAFKLNLSASGKEKLNQTRLLECLRDTGKWRAVEWDGVTPLDVALQVEFEQ